MQTLNPMNSLKQIQTNYHWHSGSDIEIVNHQLHPQPHCKVIKNLNLLPNLLHSPLIIINIICISSSSYQKQTSLFREIIEKRQTCPFVSHIRFRSLTRIHQIISLLFLLLLNGGGQCDGGLIRYQLRVTDIGIGSHSQ